jgi:glycosyltransferase involved in cell wall biosynthesis
MGGTVEATSNLGIPLVYTASDYVLTCRRGIYLKQDNTICSAKEGLALCTACMGPHTRLENWLTRTWHMTPQSLARTLLPVAENIMGKKADFVQAEASIEHRLAYLSKWKHKIERIVAPSTYMRDMLVLNNFPPEKIVISPYGVEAPPANFKKVTSPTLRFGFIGRITFIKGVHLLIEAFAALPEAGRERAQLTIYGGADINAGNYEQEVKRKASNLPNVRFIGKIDHSNISQVYQQLDCLIVPSIWPENSPITILEAQAYGVPVIASDVKGIADLIQHGANGLIFGNQNAHDLASQIARCLASPELVNKLANKSRLVKSIQEDARDISKLYKESFSNKSDRISQN